MARPPERLGPYLLLRPIGRGGMGVVWEGVNEATGREAALKTLSERDERRLDSLRREIAALARLHHPGIVAIQGHDLTSDPPWYAMDLVRGTTLREHAAACAETTPSLLSPSSAAGAPPGPDRAEAIAEIAPARLRQLLTIVRRLCGPLAYLHGEGLVHRDLKPDNVILGADLHPVIVDFGLTAVLTRGEGRETLHAADHPAGTPSYVAPEQVLGEPVDARADLYALGCILYELLAGVPPFRGSAEELLMQHATRPPSPLGARVPSLPAALLELVDRLLAKAPADRIGHADRVAEILADLGAEADLRPAPPSRTCLYRPTMRGRDAILGELRDAVARLSGGHGGVLLVRGESGIGKTRLLMAVANEARRRGSLVLAGECRPAAREGAAAAAAWSGLHDVMEAVADRCRMRGPEETSRLLGPGLPVLRQAFPAAFAGLPAAPPPAELPPSAARLRTLRSLRNVLSALAQVRPVLLALDDLQWADEETTTFLSSLTSTAGLAQEPILVVATYRTEDEAPGVSALAACGGVTIVEPQRLAARDVAATVAGMLAMEPPAELARFVMEQSEGAPLYVAEYVRACVEEGIVRRDPRGVWSFAEGRDLDRLALPRSLSGLLARRLESLPPSTRGVVSAAAILGREAPFSLVAAVAALPDGDAEIACSDALRRHALEERTPGTLRFTHDKLREAALAGLDPRQAQELHRRAALAIASGPGAEDRQPELALHWEQAGDAARAAVSALAGARHAAAAFRPRDAEALYRSYLRLARDPSAERAQAWSELGSALGRQGKNREALEAFGQGLREARDGGFADAEIACLRGEGHALLAIGQPAEAIQRFQTAVAECEAQHDRLGVCKSLRALGSAHLTAGDLALATQCQVRALTLARELGRADQEQPTLHDLGIVAAMSGRLDEARGLLEDAVAIARRALNRQGEGLALVNLALVLSQASRAREAREAAERGLALTRETGDRPNEATALSALANLALAAGDTSEARRLQEQVLLIHREGGHTRKEAFALGSLGRIDLHAEAFASALARSEAAAALFRASGDPRAEADSLALVARCHLLERRPAQALTTLERVLPELEATRHVLGHADALVTFARALEATGRTEDAEAAFVRAVASLRATGAGPQLARTLVAHATARVRRGEPEGIAPWLAEAEGLLRQADDAEGLTLCLALQAEQSRRAGRPSATLEEAARAAASRMASPSAEAAAALRAMACRDVLSS